MDANRTLTVQVQRSGDKYTWELRRDGHFYPVKFSVPIYLSEEAARASGNEARTVHLAHLARLAARPPRGEVMRRRILETRNAFCSGERQRLQLACGDKVDDLDLQSSPPRFCD
jgi:hypothetical protein